MESTYAYLIGICSSHLGLAILLFVLLRSSSVVWPPIPGFPIDLLGIDLFGPLRGFIWGEAGIMLGAIMAFWIARLAQLSSIAQRLGTNNPLRQRALSHQEAASDKHGQFVRWFVIRLLTNPLFDPLSYAAGFGETEFVPYLLATLLGNLPSTAIFYFLNRAHTNVGFWTLWLTTSIFLVSVWLIAQSFLAISDKTSDDLHASHG